MNVLTHLFFPSICQHCQELNLEDSFDFCSTCRQMLTLIHPATRCPICFKADFENTCDDCRKKSSSIKRMAAAFDFMGLPAAIVQKLTQDKSPKLAKDAAAFLVLQLSHLNWPPFDLIAPIPHSGLPKSASSSMLLAKALGEFFDRPTVSLLKRELGNLPNERIGQVSDFRLKTKVDIADKTILLIDDVIHTGDTMRIAAATLGEGFPKAIYGLALCRN